MFNTSVLLIIVICLVSIRAWKDQNLFRKLIFNPYQIKEQKEWYRFITSGFIHADYGHLFFNCFSLFLFGNTVLEFLEYALGLGDWASFIFVLIFILGVILSDIPSYLKHNHTATYNSLGASGGVSSIVFASIIIYPTSSLYLLFIPIPIPAFIFGILYLIYSFYMSKNNYDRINHSAHFIGSVFGIVAILLIEPSLALKFIEQIKNWEFKF